MHGSVHHIGPWALGPQGGTKDSSAVMVGLSTDSFTHDCTGKALLSAAVALGNVGGEAKRSQATNVWIHGWKMRFEEIDLQFQWD